MKNIKFLSPIIFLTVSLIACQKEVSDPEIHEIIFSLSDINGLDSIVTEGVAGELLKITVKTDASMCVVWPAGIRDTLKSNINPDADSINIHGVVMRRCDDYDVYHKLHLSGTYGHYMQPLVDMSGFVLNYMDEETEEPGYLRPGQYVVKVVTTKDGYNGAYKSHVVEKIFRIN